MATSPTRTNYYHNLVGVVALGLLMVGLGLGITSQFYKTVLIFCCINGVAAIGLCLLLGYGGQISLAQSSFFGLGAYTVANLAQRFHLDPVLTLLAATLVPAIAGWLIARPLLRLSSHYLAMATLALCAILYICFSQLQTITGGLDPGVVSLPRFAPFGVDLGETVSMYWVSTAFVLTALIIAINIVHSRVGRALTAIRSGEIAAASLGIDIVRYKIAIFAIAAGMAGFAGGQYAFFVRSFNATAFDVSFSIELLMMVVVGSVTTPWGALLGAAAITILPSLLENFDQYKLLGFGLAMMAIMVFMPDGLAQGLFDLARSPWRCVK